MSSIISPALRAYECLASVIITLLSFCIPLYLIKHCEFV